jgi:ribosomal protein S18 acetylase RimI-like enzyme
LPSAVRYRQAIEADDPERISRLVAATGVFSVEEAKVAGELATSTLDGSETYQFLFAEAEQRVLGYTCFDRIPLSAVSFDLYWIAVGPSARGTGLATELMTRTAELIRAQGGLQIFAETSSREDYAAARAFYGKAGFAEAARFEDFYTVGDAKIVFRLGV